MHGTPAMHEDRLADRSWAVSVTSGPPQIADLLRHRARRWRHHSAYSIALSGSQAIDGSYRPNVLAVSFRRFSLSKVSAVGLHRTTVHLHPGIWVHFEDDRYRDGGVCLHIHIRDLIETWEPDEGDDRAATVGRTPRHGSRIGQATRGGMVAPHDGEGKSRALRRQRPVPRVVICCAKTYSNPVLYRRHLAASPQA